MKTLTDYIQRLTIGQGRHAGAPFKLLAWQRRFIRGAFAPDVQASALSIARANGKSVLVAAIGAGAIDIGAPLVEPMGETIIVASSFATRASHIPTSKAFLRAYACGSRGGAFQGSRQHERGEHC